LLAEVQGREVEEVEELLLVGERARLVRGDQAGAFAFSHDKIRECLYAEVSTARRRRLHERVGLALEARPGRTSAQQLADLAFHFARSGDRARGATYSRRAAEQALRTYAPTEAVAHYRAALDLLDPDDGQRGDLLLGLGEATLLAGAEAQAVATYAAAQAWFQQRGDPIATAQAARGRGLAYWRLDAPAQAREALEMSLALLDAAQHPEPETVQTLVDLANLLGVVLGQQDEAIVYGQRALELTRSLGDGHLEAAASRTVGFLLVRENDIAAGSRLLEHALAIASANDDLGEATECCAYLAQAYCWSADFERSRQVSLRREEFARRCQQPHQLCYVYTWLAFLHAARGAWGEAERLLAQAQPAVERVVSAEPLAFLRQIRGFLAYQRGDYTTAERELRAALATFREKHPGELVLCLGMLGLVLLAAGKRQEARACTAEQEAVLATFSAGRLPTLSAQGCLALMAVAMGDNERTASFYPGLLTCQGQHHWFLVDRILGAIATLRGDWPAGEVHLAAAGAQREGLRPEMGRILVAQADLELARGGPGSAVRARGLLGEALALFEELDMAGETSHARQRLRDLPRQPGLPAPQPLPAGLSSREAEVLRLVAAGRSNRQIAQDLAISESTVAKHLTSIFNKTATDNRAAATAFAIRHGLA
jgi:DNA-binding CsgD family transcriptional regulator/tetratricopeptide (TPR) repeat protein